MPFKVKNKRNDDGTYTLSYGKGKQKLTTTMRKGDDGWNVADAGVEFASFTKMKDCKAAWGEWAEDAYGNESGSKAKSETPPDQQSPAPPATPGPPTFTQPAPKSKPEPKTEAKPEPLAAQHHADPFDPRLRYGQGENKGLLTPLGVLVEIGAWCERHAEVIKQVERKAYPQAPFSVLLDQVKTTIRREGPDILKETPDVAETQTPESAAAEPSTPSAGSGPPPLPSFNRGGSAEQYLDSTPDEHIPF